MFMRKTYSGVRVDWTAVDIEVVLGKDLRALINSTTRSIENTPKHVFRHTKFKTVAGEFNSCLMVKTLVWECITNI